MQRLEQEIARALEDVPGVSALALFGSRATGGARPDSDLDIAVLSDHRARDFRRRLQSTIAVALAELASQGRVDVVFIDEAPDLLRQRIMETARLIRCSNPAEWRAWRVRTMRELGDREPVRRLLRRAQRRRLEQGGPGGRSGRALGSLGRAGRLPR